MWDKLREQLKAAGLDKAVEEELRTGIALQQQISERNQEKIAAANRAAPRRGIDGLGQTRLCMDPFQRALADIHFGRGWHRDKATVRRLLQKHPEFAVPYQKTATVAVIKP